MSRQKVTALASKLGVQVEAGRNPDGTFCIELLAPSGFVFAGNDAHICIADGGGWDLKAADLWKEMLEELQYGLIECECEDCK